MRPAARPSRAFPVRGIAYALTGALACAMALLASACGQTGDLYLPDPKPTPAASAPPAPAAAPDQAAGGSGQAGNETLAPPAPTP